MIKCISLLKALPGQSHEEFAAYWTGPHAALDVKLPHLRKYIINVLDVPTNSKCGGCALFDGIGELWFDSIEDMNADYATAAGAAANADGVNLCEACLSVYVIEHEMKNEI